MRSSIVVRASDCQCTSCNGHWFDSSIRRHSGIWGAADEAVLDIVRKKYLAPILMHNFWLSSRFFWALLCIGPQCCGSGSVCFWASRIRHYFVRKRILPTTSKKSKKNLDFTFLWLLLSFLSLKIDVNVPQKNLEEKLFGWLRYLSFTDEKSRIRPGMSGVRIRGSWFGSVPRWHGSTTLVFQILILSEDSSPTW